VRSEKKEGVRLSEWFVLCLVMVCATLFSAHVKVHNGLIGSRDWVKVLAGPDIHSPPRSMELGSAASLPF